MKLNTKTSIWKICMVARFFVCLVVFGYFSSVATAAQRPLLWDWQLSAPFDLTRDVDVFALDADNVTKAKIKEIKSRGTKTVCYVSVGTAEDFRDDISKFPASVMGKTLSNWASERYLDIRKLKVLLPIMTKRFERCAAIGFDAVEADNLDVYSNDSGFELTDKDTIRYAIALVKIAKSQNLEIVQKNLVELIPELEKMFDFIMVENCFAQKLCDELKPYLDAGKIVLNAEYIEEKIDFPKACKELSGRGISLILKNWDLTSYYKNCRIVAKQNPIRQKLKITNGSKP